MAKTKIGIVGCGAIGTQVAQYIDRHLRKETRICGVADLFSERVGALRKVLRQRVRVLTIDELVASVDLVIEAASQECAHKIIIGAIKHKKDVVILSVGALIRYKGLLRKVEQSGIKVYVPSGAIAGVDAIGALRNGNITRISLITSKPPVGLMNAPYFKKKRLDLTRIKKPTVVFKGGVGDAIRHFPKNINVAAILWLASGSGDVNVFIKADPTLKRNVHRIEVEAKEARIVIEVQNVPSHKNPKTSSLAILSTQRLLQKLFSSVKVGS